MKHKFLFSLLCILTCLSLGGCENEIQNLSDEQMAAIGNYSAGILLKYDANSRSRLVSENEIEKYDTRMARIEQLKQLAAQRKEQQVEEPEPTTNEGASVDTSNSVVYSNLTDFYVLPENVRLSYAGYDVLDEYSDGVIKASAGKSLLVAKFILANSGTDSVDLDFFGLASSYKLTVNNQYSKGVFTTILMEDLATYIGSLAPGEREELVLITEMDKNELSDVESLILKIKNVSNEYTIPLE